MKAFVPPLVFDQVREDGKRRSVIESNQPVLDGHTDQFNQIVDAELRHEVGTVPLDGFHAHPELFSYCTVSLPFTDEL